MTSDAEKSRIVRQIIEKFIRDKSCGNYVVASEVIAEHPQFRTALEVEFKRLEQVIAAMDKPSSVASPTTGERGSIRCPLCSQLSGAGFDIPWSDVECASCGSTFGLSAEKTAERQPLGEIAHFSLLYRLGVGSFGTVWKAYDTKLERHVAIKIPRAAVLSELEQEKFQREARSAAQLRHPNIVAVHEIGQDGGLLYIVSDFVEGQTLSDWLATHGPSVREVVEITRTVATALDYAHQMGVIHRDLKPANVVVDASEQPHVLDFGLAKRVASDATITAEGQLVGTPAYMSPEQARGQAQTADRRSDVYSLGAMLYLMVTGELPFRGSVQMVIHQVLQETPMNPRKLNDRVPLDVETICLKCLEKEPAKRYATAGELAADLDRYLEGKPILARRVGSAGRFIRWAKRHPSQFAMGLLILLAVGVGASVSTYFGMQAAASASAADAMERATGEIGTKLISDYEAALTKAETDLNTYRGFYRYRLKVIGGMNTEAAMAALNEFPEDYRDDQWKLTYSILQATGEVASLLYSADETATSATFSPASSLAGVVTAKKIVVVKLTDGEVLTEVPSNEGDQAVLAQDGYSLAVFGSEKRATIWQLPTGERLGVLEHDDHVEAATFSPAGGLLATATGSHQIYLWDRATLKRIETKHDYRHNYVSALEFDGDDRLLISGGMKDISFWNVMMRTRQMTRLRIDLAGQIRAIRVIPPGQRVMILDDQKLWLAGIPGKAVANDALIERSGSIQQIATSSDGSQFLTADADGTISIHQSDTGESIVNLGKLTPPVLAVAFTANRDAVVAALADGHIVRIALK